MLMLQILFTFPSWFTGPKRQREKLSPAESWKSSSVDTCGWGNRMIFKMHKKTGAEALIRLWTESSTQFLCCSVLNVRKPRGEGLVCVKFCGYFDESLPFAEFAWQHIRHQDAPLSMEPGTFGLVEPAFASQVARCRWWNVEPSPHKMSINPQEFRESWYGCFQKWWYPTTMGFPTKNDHFGVFWGYPPFLETPICFGEGMARMNSSMCINCLSPWLNFGRRASSCERTTKRAPSGKAGDGILWAGDEFIITKSMLIQQILQVYHHFCCLEILFLTISIRFFTKIRNVGFSAHTSWDVSKRS